MRYIEERLIEHSDYGKPSFTNWRGARVTVRIEIPTACNTMSSQMIISEDDLWRLRFVRISERLRIYLDTEQDEAQRRFAMMEYEQGHIIAQRIVDRIAGEIANQLTEAVGHAYENIPQPTRTEK